MTMHATFDPRGPLRVGRPLSSGNRFITFRKDAAVDRWIDYLAERSQLDQEAGRLGRLVSVMGSFHAPPARLWRKVRACAVAVLEALAATTHALVRYRFAAGFLRVTTSWRGVESDEHFHGRLGYAFSLARCFVSRGVPVASW